MRLRLVLALAIASLSMACQQRTQTAGGASVEIISPNDGDSVEQPFEVQFRVSGTDIGPTNTGKDHLHIYVDGGDYKVHESTDPYKASGLPAGSHRVEVVIARANHDETETKDEISVTVTGAGGSTPSPAPDVGY
jgi:hypothetical protein